MQLGGFLSFFIHFLHLINRSLIKTQLEIPGIVDKIKKSKSIQRAFSDARYNFIKDKYGVNFTKLRGLGLTLTNSEIKYFMKMIRSSQNRAISLKGTTRKIPSQKQLFLNFIKALVSVGLPLMVNVLTSLAKTIFVPLVLTAAA